jgi:hypothetical protein
VNAELVERNTGRTLFEHSYWYDMHTLGSLGHLTTFTPEDKYGFDDSKDVIAHPDIVAAGFRAAIPMIAQALKEDLKKD